ncbi:mgpp2cl-1, protein phosphatase 2C-like protein 1 [Ciborinia camelliae]|nr:mgpp2cl-1, protein phosphatase 2C-like protein 1 [Ciborinia camelliae]
MFGSSSSPPKETAPSNTPPTNSSESSADSSTGLNNKGDASAALRALDGESGTSEKRSGNGSPQGRPIPGDGSGEKKRRSSGVGSKASSFLASAKNSLHFSQSPNSSGFMSGGRSGDTITQTPLQKLGKQDPALTVPQGQHNNSAGESRPGPRSTFKVGVWEDRNKKCRRTMEDTHAFLYNFLHTPAPVVGADSSSKSEKSDKMAGDSSDSLAQPGSAQSMMETDNGYFAIFDGHAGTFAADWCGKKLHLILEETIRKNPNAPIPELLDQTFTTVDMQLEKLPLKNSGCTAVTAVLRWEDRIPNASSATGSTAIAPATAAAVKAAEEMPKSEDSGIDLSKSTSQQPNATANAPQGDVQAKLKGTSSRARVLYTANVGDARIVLCRNGKALRLSYDHKGSDENEGKRVANAGGLILNNRVNGVLAVTRALGDAYMKDLVTGHPYTTETVIQPDSDEFIILACDGLWDVCSDQEAVDLVRHQQDPVAASKQLVEYALARFSTDNLSCMIVRFNRPLLVATAKDSHAAIGVEGDGNMGFGKLSEADKIVSDSTKKVNDGGSNFGVSGCNSGAGYDPKFDGAIEDDEGKAPMERVVEEEPQSVDNEFSAPEIDLSTVEKAKAEETSKNLHLPDGVAK